MLNTAQLRMGNRVLQERLKPLHFILWNSVQAIAQETAGIYKAL